MIKSSQTKSEEVAFWDKVASQRIYSAFDREEYSFFMNSILSSDLTGLKVLDVGSASGVTSAMFAARGAFVHAIDISPELVAQSKDLWREYSNLIDFQVGDAENINLSEGSVDVVFFGGVLHHFPQRERVLSEAYRVLRDQGILIAVEPNRLDFLEIIEWAIADLRGKLTPNEFPINPYIMKSEMKDAGFKAMQFSIVRKDIPVLAQIPLLKLYFDRNKGFWLKEPLLRIINAFRAPECRGNFFLMTGRKYESL